MPPKKKLPGREKRDDRPGMRRVTLWLSAEELAQIDADATKERRPRNHQILHVYFEKKRSTK